MSRYKFIASDCQLPEVDLSGFVKLTIKDLKNMTPRPQCHWDLNELGDDCEVLYASNETDTGGLQISLCTNPPHGLEEYIKKRYIYWLNGNYDLRCIDQLQEFLQSNLEEGNCIELWSVWFGVDKMEELIHKKCHLSDINSLDLELLKHTDCCISLE